jgi:hypothetical protein
VIARRSEITDTAEALSAELYWADCRIFTIADRGKIAATRERRERHKDMLAELDQTGENQLSLTDPDSRAMAAHTHVAVGYNVQVAVDAKHKLIVEQQVTNQVVDMGLLAQTAEPAKEVLGVERIAVVADRGYFKIEDIEACEEAGIDPYVPRPQRGPSVRAGLFRKDEFSYDPTSDSFLCPAGQRLHPYSFSLMHGLKKINYCNRQACRGCTRGPATGSDLGNAAGDVSRSPGSRADAPRHVGAADLYDVLPFLGLPSLSARAPSTARR